MTFLEVFASQYLPYHLEAVSPTFDRNRTYRFEER
jgi:hypothetical protein